MSVFSNFIQDEVKNCVGTLLETAVEHLIRNNAPHIFNDAVEQHTDLAAQNIINKMKESSDGGMFEEDME